MSEIIVGGFTFNEKLVNTLKPLTIQLNVPFNKITINDCFLFFKENDKINELDIDDATQLLELWMNLYKKYGVECNIDEIKECIIKTIKVFKTIWINYSWNFGSYTLDYFLRKIVEVNYTEILSFTHLILLINYYLYNDKRNYYENHYDGSDRTMIYFKEIWDDIVDDMHNCEICEHICDNINADNDYQNE